MFVKFGQCWQTFLLSVVSEVKSYWLSNPLVYPLPSLGGWICKIQGIPWFFSSSTNSTSDHCSSNITTCTWWIVTNQYQTFVVIGWLGWTLVMLVIHFYLATPKDWWFRFSVNNFSKCANCLNSSSGNPNTHRISGKCSRYFVMDEIVGHGWSTI